MVDEPRVPARGHPGSLPRALAALVAMALLLTLPGGLASASARSPMPAGGSPPHLEDGRSVEAAGPGGTVYLNDSVALPNTSGAGTRCYGLALTASGPSNATAELQTEPRVDWAGAGQFPWGPDNLPPLASIRPKAASSAVKLNTGWPEVVFQPLA